MSRFPRGCRFRNAALRLKRALLSTVDKSNSLAWIVIRRTNFERHALLHEFVACWHAMGATQGNAATTQKMVIEQFPGRNLLVHRSFELLHGELCASRSLYASKRDTSTGRYYRSLAVKEVVLRRVNNCPSIYPRDVRLAVCVSQFIAIFINSVKQEPHSVSTFFSKWRQPHWNDTISCTIFDWEDSV